MNAKHPPQPLRMSITWEILDIAKRAGDQVTIAACRRIITANRIGWRDHGDPADMRHVLAIDSIIRKHGAATYANLYVAL